MNNVFVSVRVVVGAMLVASIGITLLGVLLRHVMFPLTEIFGLTSFNYFWVEEVGEMLMAWMSALGAGACVVSGEHFAVSVFVHRLSPRAQQRIRILHSALTLSFGAVLVWQGTKITMMNWTMSTPGLGASFGWLYMSCVAAGISLILFAIIELINPRRRLDPLAAVEGQ
jgi:TRAP-type C4-dicarboxylate transport system permease small subunit